MGLKKTIEILNEVSLLPDLKNLTLNNYKVLIGTSAFPTSTMLATFPAYLILLKFMTQIILYIGRDSSVGIVNRLRAGRSGF
jgi:hypothetical protein